MHFSSNSTTLQPSSPHTHTLYNAIICRSWQAWLLPPACFSLNVPLAKNAGGWKWLDHSHIQPKCSICSIVHKCICPNGDYSGEDYILTPREETKRNGYMQIQQTTGKIHSFPAKIESKLREINWILKCKGRHQNKYIWLMSHMMPPATEIHWRTEDCLVINTSRYWNTFVFHTCVDAVSDFISLWVDMKEEEGYMQ